MHDILKQPTYISRLLRNLPRAAAWTSELYVLLLPWRKQQDLPKMALGVRMQINETCSISQIQNCLMRNFKIWSPSTRTDGNTILCTYVAVQWQRPIERSCTSDCSLVPSYILFACIFAHFFALATFVQISSGNLWIRQSSPNNLYNVLRSTSTTNRK